MNEQILVKNFNDFLECERIYEISDVLALYDLLKYDSAYDEYYICTEPYEMLYGKRVAVDVSGFGRKNFINYLDSLYELGVVGQAAFEHAMERDT